MEPPQRKGVVRDEHGHTKAEQRDLSSNWPLEVDMIVEFWWNVFTSSVICRNGQNWFQSLDESRSSHEP
jgi:hypothetical protein